MNDPLGDDAERAWPALARMAALPDGGWSVTEIARREDARVARLVRRYRRDGESLVLKCETRPRHAAAFLEQMTAQDDAVRAFPDDPGYAIPRLRAVDPDRQACLMDDAEGVPLARALAETPSDRHPALLERAGAWVSRFHASRPGTVRIFQPKFSYAYLDRILDEIATGARAVAAPDRFRTAAARFKAERPRYEGRTTQAAMLHGDLHLRNIVIGARVWGIDMQKGDMAPVGHDIARLLVDYAARHADQARIAPGAVLPEDARAGFFAGYRFRPADDPSIEMLLRHRILADWWGLPAAPSGRSLAQDLRLGGLLTLAARTFGA